MTSLEEVKTRAEIDARARGYYLNYNINFLSDLLEGLKTNEARYGYPSCPCRMASGIFELDRDIICPCEYRDQDIQEFGACFCSLYVSKKVYEEKIELVSIPERRPVEKQFQTPDVEAEQTVNGSMLEVHRKIMYCKQCGYVTFREEPPFICPICRASKERFSKIMLV